MAASLTVSAFAAGPVTGKVTKVDGDKVTVAVEGAVPAWVKKGASVTAAGGTPKIVAVEGSAASGRENMNLPITQPRFGVPPRF